MRHIDHHKSCVSNYLRAFAAFLTLAALTLTAVADEKADPFERSDFPRWSGPNDDMHATSRGIELVDDLKNARMVWRSSEAIPGAHANWSNRALRHLPASGGSSPIVYQGNIYHYYYELTGDKVVPRENVAEGRARRQPEWARRAGADDVMLCVDAASGRTIWKRVLGPSVNLQIMKSPARLHTSPCAFDGRVYALGMTARVYCIDAETGKTIWQKGLPGLHERCEALRKEALTENKVLKHLPIAGKRGPGHNLTYVDGILLVGAANGVYAYEGKSGKFLWKVGGVLGAHATPTIWRHKGKSYVLASSKDVTCIEPRTGKVLWRTESAGGFLDSPCRVSGDVVVFAVKSSDKAPGREGKSSQYLGGWRISPEGAKPLWEMTEPVHNLAEHSYFLISDGHLYHPLYKVAPPGNWNPDTLCVDVQTGKVVSTATLHRMEALAMVAEGRLFAMPNPSRQTSDLQMFNADPNDFRPIGGWWYPPHIGTGGKNGAFIQQPYADGFLFVRGQAALFCYDIRKNPPTVTITAPAHHATLGKDELVVESTAKAGSQAITHSAIYVDGKKRQQVEGPPPAKWKLDKLTKGLHEIRVEVTDGKTVSADWVTVGVDVEQKKVTQFPLRIDAGSGDTSGVNPPGLPDHVHGQRWMPGKAYGYVSNAARTDERVLHDWIKDYDPDAEQENLYVWRRTDLDGPLHYRLCLPKGGYHMGFGYLSRREPPTVTIAGKAVKLVKKTWGRNADRPVYVTAEPVEVDGLVDLAIGSDKKDAKPLDSLIVDTKPIADLGVAKKNAAEKRDAPQKDSVPLEPLRNQ